MHSVTLYPSGASLYAGAPYRGPSILYEAKRPRPSASGPIVVYTAIVTIFASVRVGNIEEGREDFYHSLYERSAFNVGFNEHRRASGFVGEG